MKPGFEDFMAIELKREIAERYFGFRKMIEEDKLDLMKKNEIPAHYTRKENKF